jgi:hypothetical protein
MPAPTSLKGALQGLQIESMELLRGEVISASPLEIRVDNDPKRILREAIICLPRHLSNYVTTCDIEIASGDIDAETGAIPFDGSHDHGTAQGPTTPPGSAGGGAHSHKLTTFKLTGAKIAVHNALKVGERVFILSFNQGKKYYIFDREV